MSSQDDPEARIRQLEEQSANYGAVELGSTPAGSGGPAPTSPLPPPVYGTDQVPVPPYGVDPYQGNPYQPPFGTQFTPIPKRGGTPVGLIIGLIVFVVVAIFGGVGAIIWNTVSKTNTPHVTIGPSNPGGSFDVPGNGPTIEIPTLPSVMPTIPSMPGDEPQTGTPGGQLSVAGIDKNQTIACNDANVNVSGVNNTVHLTGHCRSVTVSGVNNRVQIESTDKIGASGFDNQVTYQSGDPQIDSTDSNTVRKG
jgi:hypothetical protein